ncbi:MAG: cytidine deaminase [Planctomycetota bacterium]
MEEAVLVRRAIEAAGRAYAPYSRYSVGAALVGEDGRVFAGCNVENASYGLTICAERNAIFHAVAEGCRSFEKIIVVTKDGGSPCGACRQVLSEFGPMEVVLGRLDGEIMERTTSTELLPNAFGP